MTIIIKKEKTFGGDRYVHDIDCGDGFMVLYLPVNLSSCIYYICTAFCMSIVTE